MSGLVIQSPGICTDRTLPMRNPLWTPSLLPGRAFDLDCDIGVVADLAGNVQSWTDQASRIVMTSIEGTPTHSHAIGTRTGVRFQLDRMESSAVIAAAPAYWCWWAVLDLTDISVAPGQNLFNNGGAVYLPNVDGNVLITGFGPVNYAPWAVTAGKHILILSQQVAGTQALRVDGVQVGQPQTQCQPLALGRLELGKYDPGMKDASIGAFGFAAGVQAIADVQKLEGYLAARFGLPLPGGHPFAATPPRKLD